MADKLTKATFKRTVALNRLQESHEVGKAATTDESLKSTFLARASEANKIYEDFQAAQNTIISLIPDDEFKINDAVRMQADQAYYGIKSIKCDLSINDSMSAANTSSFTSTPTHTRVAANIPKLNLPIFDGVYKNWPGFFDLYNSIIHNNSGLTNVEKFQYLLTSVINEPLTMLKGLPVTENNYPIAYDLLEKRYQNKRILATQYYNELYHAQCIHKPNAKEIRSLVNVFSENVAAFRGLQLPVDHWDFLLFNLLLNKLDTKTRTDFELENSLNAGLPTYRQLITFLEKQCIALESIQYTSSMFSEGIKPKASNSSSYNPKRPPCNFLAAPSAINSSNDPKCLECASSHALPKCPRFLNRTPKERYAFAKQHSLCVNCLVSPHALKNCGSTHKCRICKSPHHTVLHFNKNNNNSSTRPTFASSSEGQSGSCSELDRPNSPVTNTHCITNTLSMPQHTILLSTCEVDIKDIRGHYQRIRVLLDTGSMANFISEQCAHRLGLSRSKLTVPIEGLNGMSTTTTSGLMHCVIKPRGQSNPIFSLDAIIIPSVCSNQPRLTINRVELEHIRNLNLADSRFHVPGPIDMLIGAELVPLFLKSGRISGAPDQPIALETVFGYVLQGRVNCLFTSTTLEPLQNFHASINENFDFQLQKFWEIEQISEPVSLSSEDKRCEDIYSSLTFREPSGRFSVPLPFRQSAPVFVDTYSLAYRRYSMLERRFLKNDDLYKKYCAFMQDYLDSGHMSLVPQNESRSPTAYYIAHHAVFKEQLSGAMVTSKLRVVFDASMRDIQGCSLNDALLVGPKLQLDIFQLLLSFRFFAYVFICDIKQMYRQINIQKEFWNYQRILWRFKPSESLQEYFLRTVTYGVSSSPYLALRTLRELAKQEEATFPVAADCVLNRFYIDDGLVGTNDLPSALSLQAELISIFKKGGFELGKWASNHPDLLVNLPSCEIQQSCTFDKEEPSFIKILGLKWDPTSDNFSYSYVPIERPCSKRHILSEISRIFDPLGFVSPCLLLAQRLLQLLWESQISWDETPSEEIITTWSKFKSEMHSLALINIPRYIGASSISRIELHGFCDASQIGYASVVYFRIEDTSGLVKTFLVCAKCRVAPLKTQSIPRLELLGAVLLSNLISSVKSSYSKLILFDATYAWSDSMVTLAWLSASPHKWKTFVANRVSHVQERVPKSSWKYVPSGQNPADCASRGQTPAELLDTVIWWSGPDFLSRSRDFWPIQPQSLIETSNEISVEEQKTVLNTSVVPRNFILFLLDRYSSLQKIKRMVAYMVRFISNVRSKTNDFQPLSINELQASLKIIVRRVQQDIFADIFRNLNQNTLLPKPLRKLALFVDLDGMLRVGGRLRNSNLGYEAKHPLLLPKSHRLTDLIIESTHSDHLHPGLKTMQYLLLQQFWILSPRSAIYRCLSKCLRCFRCKPKSYNPYMADLPSLRVAKLKAFSSVCVDFAGPFSLVMSKHRGAKTFKGYVCIFVCTVTKAIHLELTSDLSTDTFLAAFRRFIARRGNCLTITSDQGTNFKGAYNQLLKLAQGVAQDLSLRWNFNPPGAPHFNGLAESGVKSFKSHLYRVLGSQILSYEEFCTLLTQIEAVLNSRPLCPVSNDPNDLQPLTPGHFLVLEPLNSPIPEINLADVPLNRLSRWQLIQRLQADFWKQWSQQYLHHLQERHKWTDPSPTVSIGDLVLIKSEPKGPLQWELGRIINLHPGKDNVVRVVTLKTNHGTFQRPVVKICPLPGN